MAGTFTHWMIVEEVVNRLSRDNYKHGYFSMVLDKNHFVNLGAVGPDYPYLSELEKNYLKMHSWADRMHYENTGEVVKQGAIMLANDPNHSGGDFEICLAWLCGYASHLIADVTIHPVVNATVGPYVFNKGEHIHCEVIQDSYIFHEIKGTELNYAEYVGLIEFCSGEDKNHINRAIGKFWEELLMTSHPGGKDYFGKIDPDDWHKHFVSTVSRCTTGGVPIPFSRHWQEDKSIAYKRTKDISVAEREKFIEKVKLPNGKTGDFKTDAFNKAVDNVIGVWKQLFDDIKNKTPGNCSKYIKNWNLDTGVDEDQIYFWS